MGAVHCCTSSSASKQLSIESNSLAAACQMQSNTEDGAAWVLCWHNWEGWPAWICTQAAAAGGGVYWLAAWQNTLADRHVLSRQQQ
jgi:hypothetical protein